MKPNIKSYLQNSFIKGTVTANYNIKSAAILGSIGHPLFAVLHLYVFNMAWDSLILKGFGSLMCLLLLTKKRWPERITFLFPAYWHLTLIYLF